MKPKFKHDCDKCEFVGHFFNHDVYFCGNSMVKSNTIVARASDEGPDYASTPFRLAKAWFDPEHQICIGEKVINYQDYLFSTDSIPYEKAMIMALASRTVSLMRGIGH